MVSLLCLLVLSLSQVVSAHDDEHAAEEGVCCVASAEIEKDEYDSINWVDLKRKEHAEEQNWYSKFKAVLFRERTKESLTGDDITIVETLEVGQGDPSDDNVVSIIKIQ